MIPLHLVIQFFHEFARDLVLVAGAAARHCGSGATYFAKHHGFHIVLLLVLRGLKQRLFFRCQLCICPRFHILAACHTGIHR